MAQVQLQSAEVKEKIYFSPMQGLTLWPTPSKRVVVDGQHQTVDGSPIQFHPIGDGWGRYATSDPDLIEYLENRAKTMGDIMTFEQYKEKTTPPEQRLEEAQRQISSQNDLIADLRRREEELQKKLSTKK